nr:GNAT family protein [Stakelama sediminis]
MTLRPRRIADADALFPSFADTDLMQWWSGPPHSNVEQTRESFARHSPDWRAWAITLANADDTAIGFLAAGEKRQGNVTEIGYMLSRPYWRQGIAREAVTLLIDQIFAEGQRRIFADTDPDNLASRRLLESLGFTLEGQLRGEWETHIGIRDSVIYGLLTTDWHHPTE